MIEQGLKPTPVPLVTGTTYGIDTNASYWFVTTNDSFILYFSNEMLLKVYTNSDFTINIANQEVLNLSSKIPPQKAKFGSHNFAGTLINGTIIISYSGETSNSSCVVSTPMTDIELHNGLFYFRVTDNNLIVFVLKGSIKSYNDKLKENVITKGYALISVHNDVGILESKISLVDAKIKDAVLNTLIEESKEVTDFQNTIMFASLYGNVLGILLNL